MRNLAEVLLLGTLRTMIEAVAAAPLSGLAALHPAATGGGGLVSLSASLGAASEQLLPRLEHVFDSKAELLSAAAPEELRLEARRLLQRLAGSSALPLGQQKPADWLRLHSLAELHACTANSYILYNAGVLGALQLLHACGIRAELGADDTEVRLSREHGLVFLPHHVVSDQLCCPPLLQAHTMNVQLACGRTCRLLVRSCKAPEDRPWKMRVHARVEVQTGIYSPFKPGSFDGLLAYGEREGQVAWQLVSAAELYRAGMFVGPGAALHALAFGDLRGGGIDRLGGIEFSTEQAAALLP